MASLEVTTDPRAFLRSGGMMAELMRTHEWASTPLGPLETWPAALKAAVATALTSVLPTVLIIGEEAIAIYNDANAELFGMDHRRTLGSRAQESWPADADLIEQAVKAAERGEAISLRDLERISFRNRTPEPIWVNINISPVRDETGAVLGIACVTVDNTERVLAERKVARQFDFMRNMFDQTPGFICLMGPPPDFVVEYVNEAHKQLFGEHQTVGRPAMEAFGDIAASTKMESIFQSLARGERSFARGDPVVVPTPDGRRQERFIDMVTQPLRDEDGRMTGVYAQGFDVTPQMRAQQAAEETARRLSAAITVARLGAYEANLETGEVELDARAREIFGFGPDQHLTVKDLMDRVDPEDLHRLNLADAAALASGQTRREDDYRVRLPDGTVRHVRSAADLVPGPQGRVAQSLGLLEDVTERRRAEQRQRMLINELNHRVKNTLATVQSIAAQTLRSAPDLEQARAAFESRLMALSAAHDILTAQSWRGAHLEQVAAHALAPFEAGNRPRIAHSGPAVWLDAARALALSLALHELATNAVKYGALSVPEGRGSFRWRVEAGELVCVWTERGGPPPAPPSRSGFGMRLLERNLAREMEGQVVLDFAPTGLRCEIRCPVDQDVLDTELHPSDTSPSPGRFWAPDIETRSFG